MMSSKGASTVSCPALSAGCGGSLPRAFSVSAIAPSLSALLGFRSAEVEPSEATSAARYDQFKGILVAPVVVPDNRLGDEARISIWPMDSQASP